MTGIELLRKLEAMTPFQLSQVVVYDESTNDENGSDVEITHDVGRIWDDGEYLRLERY